MIQTKAERDYADACNAGDAGLREVTIDANGVWVTFGYHPEASGVTRAFCSGLPSQERDIRNAWKWLQAVGFVLTDEDIWGESPEVGWRFEAYQDARAGAVSHGPVAPGGR